MVAIGRIILGVVTGLATLAGAAFPTGTNSAIAQRLNDTFLSKICERANIKGNACQRAKRYPNGDNCNVDLSEPVVEGRFLSSATTTILIAYESGCEARATRFGGTIVFERQGADYAFKGYQPGLSIDSCISLRQDSGQDRLFCEASGMGQGHVSTSIGEIKFSIDHDKSAKTTLDALISAEESSGAYGGTSVDCKKRFSWQSVSKPRQGPAPGTLLIDASFADAAVIRTACAPNAPRIKDAVAKPPPGSALVSAKSIKEGRFVIEIATRQIHTEARFREMQQGR